MVNKLWCETVIPILWKNPWRYDIDYHNKIYLFIIIASCLPDDIKEFLASQEILLPSVSHQSLLYDYLSFCRSINIDVLNSIISIGSRDLYDQFLLQQEFYHLLMRKCPGLNSLDLGSINHQIFYFPEAKTNLESLCELRCDTSIEPSYFYGLSRFCQYIQRLIIINKYVKVNRGMVKFIEIQRNLKYFEWKDNVDYFEDYNFIENPYEEIILALAKKAEVLNHLIITFIDYHEYTFLQNVLTKLYKLKSLKINNFFINFSDNQLKKLIYHELEIFNIDCISLNSISNIIGNSGGYLKKIIFKYYDYYLCDHENKFYEDSLIFIQKIYKNCPLIEYLSLAFSSSTEHFKEFEKLLNICQNLKSLLIMIPNTTNNEETGKELLNILIRSAPINLREIRFFDYFQFSLKNLEEFLEKWRGRPAISIRSYDPIYKSDPYMKLIIKYKIDGVIKDFKHDSVYF
ncbi:hypothetical protein RclHR1_00930021 [Rhizophagus clarus]|uniref:F-box domain-containing protein n=1 Tax=Rhizophagus clarus TaxID=94130 RepID=A0A2Z6SA15_9GLOM|nr:hypothetical protein RclHR1_00930021 [Rhizophagus clarus]GES90016.1 hypothetical protein GLOIN_2v1764020 [Rhizophagus clarus]